MSLARARRASRIITFTNLITGAWLASVRRSSIVSSSSARTPRSPPRRSVACTAVGDSAWADRIAAWISAAGASTSFTRRSYVQHSSSITVGSGTSPAATSSSPASFTPTGRRQCSSRYLGDSRCANGPAAAARRSAAERAGSAPPTEAVTRVSDAGAGSGVGEGTGMGIGSARERSLIVRSLLMRRHGRQHTVDLLLRSLQLLALALEQGVRLLVRKHDVRRDEDRDLRALAGHAAVSEEEPEQRKVLEQRHAALGELLRLSDQPADHHGVPGLHDRARLRLAGGDHGSVLRRRHRLLRQRAHLLQHAEGDVAVVVHGGDHGELRADVPELNHLVEHCVEAVERRRDERDLAADQDTGLFVVQSKDARRRQHAHVRPSGEGPEDGAHVDGRERDEANAEALQAREEGVAELLWTYAGGDPARAVARHPLLGEELPVDPVLAGTIEGHLGDQGRQQHLGRTDVERVARLS